MAWGDKRMFEEQECVNCSVVFGVPFGFTDNRRKDKRAFYCPNGHQMSYTESEADKLRRERDRLKQQTAQLQDEANQAWAEVETERRRTAAARGHVTKLKNRAANGVCPCCNRSFANLQRHMGTKHPGFATAETIQ